MSEKREINPIEQCQRCGEWFVMGDCRNGVCWSCQTARRHRKALQDAGEQ